MAEDTDALLCDMAETYHIFDIKAYPASVIARLASGLREDSRIRMKMSGQKLTMKDGLLALIFDTVNWLAWTKTRNAEHGKNRPKSLFNSLTRSDVQKEKVKGFATPEEFERRRREILEGING